jgi:hypothetical protein
MGFESEERIFIVTEIVVICYYSEVVSDLDMLKAQDLRYALVLRAK